MNPPRSTRERSPRGGRQPRPPRSRPAAPLLGAVALAAGLAACSGPFPAAPDGTLERIRADGVLRAGAAHHPPEVVHPERDGADPTGTEVAMIEDYAAELGAEVEWYVASETVLMERLETGRLDLVVAGLHADSVWADTAGLTRAYARATGPDGAEVRRVIATPAGENALMSSLERWFDDYEGAQR